MSAKPELVQTALDVVAKGKGILAVNERVHLIDADSGDFNDIVLLSRVLDKCGLVLEVGTHKNYNTVSLYAARRTRRATTVKL